MHDKTDETTSAVTIDIRIMELIASRMCHDLISPVGAINNGVELIEEIGEGMEAEAMKLISDSAARASRRLRLLRLAYGRAGSETNLSVRDVRPIIEQYIADGRVTLDWRDLVPDNSIIEQKGMLKTIMNVIILGEELLAYGGTISVRSDCGNNHIAPHCIIAVTGRGAAIYPSLPAILNGTHPVDEITPRSVQAYITGRFAAAFGLNIITACTEDGRVEFAITPIPAIQKEVADNMTEIEGTLFSHVMRQSLQ